MGLDLPVQFSPVPSRLPGCSHSRGHDSPLATRCPPFDKISVALPEGPISLCHSGEPFFAYPEDRLSSLSIDALQLQRRPLLGMFDHAAASPHRTLTLATDVTYVIMYNII